MREEGGKAGRSFGRLKWAMVSVVRGSQPRERVMSAELTLRGLAVSCIATTPLDWWELDTHSVKQRMGWDEIIAAHEISSASKRKNSVVVMDIPICFPLVTLDQSALLSPTSMPLFRVARSDTWFEAGHLEEW